MKYKFIGWCKEGIHDKVWVAISLSGDTWGGDVLTAWGRRGKKLQTLMTKDNSDLRKLIDSKQNKKNYRSIDARRLDEVYPGFKDDLEKTAIWATLKL
jgi:hypothetical protein